MKSVMTMFLILMSMDLGISQELDSIEARIDSLRFLESSIVTEIDDLRSQKEAIPQQINKLELDKLNLQIGEVIAETVTSTSGGILRASPSASSKMISKIPGNYIIKIYNSYKQPYFKIKYKEQIGYLSYGSIELNPTLEIIIKNNKKTQIRKIDSKYRSSRRTYRRGPRGGCYYINSNGNKTYVARSICN